MPGNAPPADYTLSIGRIDKRLRDLQESARCSVCSCGEMCGLQWIEREVRTQNSEFRRRPYETPLLTAAIFEELGSGRAGGGRLQLEKWQKYCRGQPHSRHRPLLGRRYR